MTDKRIIHGESGHPHKVDECRRCGMNNSRGLLYTRPTDGRHIFQCDNCGRRMSLGWEEWAHKDQVEKKGEHERSVLNRDRFQREHTEKYDMTFNKALEDMESTPDVVENFNEMLSGPTMSEEDRLRVHAMKMKQGHRTDEDDVL